ncbi:MAG TPA: ATP-binding protein [Archangium sp.]|nr:ATP-binding protein [Archangium sp.]
MLRQKKGTEEVKRETQEFSPEFRLLFEQSATMSLVVLPDADFTIVAASDTLLRATRTTREVLYGRPIFEAFPDNPEDPRATGVANVRASLLRALATKKPDIMPVQKYDVPRPEAEGGGFEERYWSPIHTPVLSPEGEVRYLLQQVDDITEVVRLTQLGEESRLTIETLRRAEATRRALRESEERLQRLVEASGIGTWEVNLSTQEVVADARYRELAGLSPDEPFTVEKAFCLILPEDSPRIVRAYAEALAGKDGGHYLVEYRTAHRPNGATRWVEARGQVRFGPDGQAVHFWGTVIDITARKLAQAQREELLEAISTQPALGVALFQGPDFIIQMANPLYRALAGHRDILGKPLLEALPEVRDQGFVAILEQVMRTGAPGIGREVPILWDRHANGQLDEGYFHFIYQPVRGPDGRVEAVLTLGQEVTDVVRARQEAEHYAEEQRKRSDFEQQLIGIVSHDLKNPLSAILLGATALARRENLDERSTKAVVRIQASAERAVRMVKDLLDFTQARLGGGIPVEPRPLDLHALTWQVMEEVRASFPERDIVVTAQGNGQGAWDADRMAQVVTNLASNALKYSAPDTPVRVRSRGDGDQVELEVHNEGAPIPPEALGRLFQPMQRASSQGDTAGRSVGLGLYIVDRIVQAHGGTIAVKSTEAEGTTFTVRLPRLAPGAAG